MASFRTYNPRKYYLIKNSVLIAEITKGKVGYAVSLTRRVLLVFK